MFSYSRELIIVVDEEFRIVDVNENFLTLLNLSREKTVRKNLAHIQIPDVDVRELLETSTKDDDTPSRSGGRKGANAYSPGNLSRSSSMTAARGLPSSLKMPRPSCLPNGRSEWARNGSG